MPDLQRLRDFTERYPHLQGLRLVPLGIPFLLSAVWPEAQLHRVPDSPGFDPEWRFMTLLAIAVLFSFEIGRDYRERFGSVEPMRNFKIRLWVFLIGAYLFGALWMQNHADEFSFPAVVIGIALAYVGSRRGEIRLHYDVCAVLALAFSALGVFGQGRLRTSVHSAVLRLQAAARASRHRRRPESGDGPHPDNDWGTIDVSFPRYPTYRWVEKGWLAEVPRH